MNTVNAWWFHIFAHPSLVFLWQVSQFSNSYIYFCHFSISILSRFFFSCHWETNPPIAIHHWNPLPVFSHSISKPSSVSMCVCWLSGCWICSKDLTDSPSLLHHLHPHVFSPELLSSVSLWRGRAQPPDTSTHAGGLVHAVWVDEV